MSSKRDQILSATRDLIFEQGLQDISMSQLAQRAQVGMGTIYNYFASKEELVFSLYYEIKIALDEYVIEGYNKNEPVIVRFQYLFNRIATYGIQHPREFRLVEQLAQVPFIYERAKTSEFILSQIIPELLAEAQKQHMLKDMPSMVMLLMIRGSLNALIEANATQQIRLNQTVLEQSVAACWDAIKR